MAVPFFFRKKFLLYYGLFVLLLLLIGIVMTAVNYFDAKENGEVRWEIITVPMALPIMGVAGYILILPMWVVYKAKQFRNQAIARIPGVLSPPPAVALYDGELQLGEPDQVIYTPPGGRGMMGELRFTNQRIVFTKTIDVRRMGEIYGMQTPDLTTSIPLNAIRQCGFGLDEKHPKNFSAIEHSGNIHTFSSIVKFNAETAMKHLGWKRTQVNEFVYWIR